MPVVRSYVVSRTQETRILSATSPAHAVALAEQIFAEESQKIDPQGQPINSIVRTTDIIARED